MDHRMHEWNCSSEALDRDPPPPFFPRARRSPEPTRAVPIMETLGPLSHALWPQPMWQNTRRDERSPYFRMVFANEDTTVTHAGEWHGGGPGRRMAGGDVDAGTVVTEGVHEFAFVLQRTHTGSKSPLLGLRGMRTARGGNEREWRLAIDLSNGSLKFDGMALHDEPDLSRWPGGVDIGFGQRIDCDLDAGKPAKPVRQLKQSHG